MLTIINIQREGNKQALWGLLALCYFNTTVSMESDLYKQSVTQPGENNTHFNLPSPKNNRVVNKSFVGALPERWEQLSALLGGKVAIHGLEVPRVIALSGPANSGKTLLIQKLANEISTKYSLMDMLLLGEKSFLPEFFYNYCAKKLMGYEKEEGKKIVFHLDKFGLLYEKLNDDNKINIITDLELLLARCEDLFIIIESRSDIGLHTKNNFKYTVESTQMVPLTSNDKFKIWNNNLSLLKLGKLSREVFDKKLVSFDPQKIHQITQQVGRRCLVPKHDRSISPFSFEKLVQEAEKFKDSKSLSYIS